MYMVSNTPSQYIIYCRHSYLYNYTPSKIKETIVLGYEIVTTNTVCGRNSMGVIVDIVCLIRRVFRSSARRKMS